VIEKGAQGLSGYVWTNVSIVILNSLDDASINIALAYTQGSAWVVAFSHCRWRDVFWLWFSADDRTGDLGGRGYGLLKVIS
jgi:hypothetical protein